MELKFFDWKRHTFLSDVAEEIITRYRKGKSLDLANVVLSLPGARALSRLEELLVHKVESLIEHKELDADWTPPVFVTIGHVPELLYPLKNTLANSLTQTLAWRMALVEIAKQLPDQFERFIPGGIPEDFLRQMKLAQIPSGLHSELAADGKTFDTVAQECRRRQVAAEVERWTFLSQLETRYFHILDDLRYWDVQTARLVACQKNECRTDRDIYVIGAPDLNTTQKSILKAVSERVHLFVYAEESQKNRFDEFGCVIPGQWTSDVLDIPDEIIVQTDKAADQVPVIMDRISQWAIEFEKTHPQPSEERFSLFRKELAICIPDDLETELTPGLKESLATNHLSLEPAAGVPGARNRIYRLLDSLADWLVTRRFAALANLVRHPDLEFYINQALADGKQTTDAKDETGADWLTLFDRYQREFLPEQLDDLPQVITVSVEGVASKHVTDYTTLAAVFALLDDLFHPFYQGRPEGTPFVRQSGEVPAEPGEELTVESIGQILENTPQIRQLVYQSSLTLQDGCSVISNFLHRIYASIIPGLAAKPEDTAWLDDTRQRKYHQIMTGILCVNKSLDELANVPDTLCPAVTGAELLRLLLDQMKTRQLSPFHEPQSVCQVGWLDLRLDDSPHVIVAGMNEGIIPTSRTNDQYLPDSLRHNLNLEDNGRRFARDLYSLTAILASRPDTLLLTSQRTLEGDPLRPSRFLFLTHPDNLPRRVCRLFSSPSDEGDKIDTTVIPTDSPSPLRSKFIVPSIRMPSPEPPSILNVTAFGSFLSSPYAFFLKNGLGLERQTDDSMELDAASFGSILHEIVGRFGGYREKNLPVWDSTDADRIYQFLSRQLDDYMKNRFRQNTSPAVAIQQEQFRNILYHFSRWQALWRQNGNEILWVEKSPKEKIVFSAGGAPMQIYGRIDRIDYNRTNHTLYVFDYKTYSSSTLGAIDEASSVVRDPQSNTLLYSNAIKNSVDTDHRVYIKNMPERWNNLQLPLYRHIAKQLVRENPDIFTADLKIHTGYIMLLKNTPTVALGAPWSDSDYDKADESIRWVIQTIRRLWKQEIRPNDLIDPDNPGWGTIWDFKGDYSTNDLWTITGIQTSPF